MAVASDRRFRKGSECPICAGHGGMRSGKGTRCWGFKSEDDRYVYCTREEFAGALPFNGRASAYCHYMGGPCRCGVTHVDGATAPAFYRTVFQIERDIEALDGMNADRDAYDQLWRELEVTTGQRIATAAPRIPGLSFSAVIESWIAEGQLERLPSLIATLDADMRGGFPSKRLVLIGGAPGAGKTTLACWWGWQWAKKGVPVGIVASDEDADGITYRFGLFEGFTVEQLDSRDPDILRQLRDKLASLSIHIFGPDVLVEDAATTMRQLGNGKPAVLIVDSTQTAQTALTSKATNARARIDAMVSTFKAAVVSGLLLIATSELNRGAYRNKDQSENYSDMAATKDSGAIEYAAQTLMVLRSEPDNEVSITIPKNRGYKRSDLRVYMNPTNLHIQERDVETESVSGTLKAGAQSLLNLIARHPGKGKVWLRTKEGLSGTVIKSYLEYLVDEERVENRGGQTNQSWFAIPQKSADDS